MEYIDVVMDKPEKYVEAEDLTRFKSAKTGRGPWSEGWQVSWGRAVLLFWERCGISYTAWCLCSRQGEPLLQRAPVKNMAKKKSSREMHRAGSRDVLKRGHCTKEILLSKLVAGC